MMANDMVPGSHTVILALGTNLDDRRANLVAVLRRLAVAVLIERVSAIYETPPWGLQDQPRFYNMALRGRSELAPAALLNFVKQIERAMGRRPSVRYGPRLIDIDILFYDDLVVDSPDLTIPHPGLTDRVFVLAPLADVAADFRHPRGDQTVADLLASIDDGSAQRVASPIDLAREILLPSGRPRPVHPAGLFAWGRQTYVMGIINATPDSFSGDGLLARGAGDAWIDHAVRQGRQFVADGAHLLDVGGESTRPGSTPVDEAEELRRVLPVIEGLMRAVDVPLSIDTSKARVAAAALEAGASLVNDVWGLRLDPDLAAVAAAAAVPVILMHNRSTPKNAAQEARLGGYYTGVQYINLLDDIRRELLAGVDLAHAAGIRDDRIILDPGLGFGKTPAQNLELLDRVNEIKTLGYPLLVGPSRKSFIGRVLDTAPDDRLEGSAAAVAVSIVRGADIVRVHDVRSMARVAAMTDAIVRRPQSSSATL